MSDIDIDAHPEFGVFQLLRGDASPGVQLETGDKVLAKLLLKSVLKTL